LGWVVCEEARESASASRVQARARVLRLEDFRGLIKEEVYWSLEQRFNVFRGSKNRGQCSVASGQLKP